MTPHGERRVSRAQRLAVDSLRTVERAIFFCIGVLLFGAAIALLYRSALSLGALFLAPAGSALESGSDFLQVVLLVLMVVELAYTVVLSLRGVVLSAEPFLIVGLIAIIRRMIVITVGEVHGRGAADAGTASSIELAVLTGVVVAFVASITLLRSRARVEIPRDNEHE